MNTFDKPITFAVLIIVYVNEFCNGKPEPERPNSLSPEKPNLGLGLQEVTHEDIRNAILSLAHLYRDSTDKLERHESRERQFAEQTKKVFASAEKKQETQGDNINNILDMLNNISTRLEKIENFVIKAEAIQYKLATIEETVEKNQQTLEDIKSNISQQLNDTQIQSVIKLLPHNSNVLPTENNALWNNIISEVNIKLTEFQPKLSRYQETFESALEKQQSKIQQVTEIAKDIRENLQKLINRDDLVQIKDSIVESLRDKFTVESREQNMLSYATRKDEQLLGALKIDQLLIQTSADIMDTKRKIEYSAHQILEEITNLIGEQSKNMNISINKRFDTISSEITKNQNTALKNVSSAIESEISQVWRQIGTMYQILTNSTETLDKLEKQTVTYMNDSLTMMDSSGVKITDVTEKVKEIDDNLNFLLGRLSLVTQEFNQTKTGLGDVLNSMRSSLRAVQEEAKDVYFHEIKDSVSRK